MLPGHLLFNNLSTSTNAERQKVIYLNLYLNNVLRKIGIRKTGMIRLNGRSV